MKLRRESTSLIGQILAVNVLLVCSTLFAASAAAGLDLTINGQRWKFLLLAMAIILVLLVNLLMLRRRFSPLEQLIARIEAVDPPHPPGSRNRGGAGRARRCARPPAPFPPA